MKRYILPAIIMAILTLCLSGCVSFKIVSVDEKTQLENQILGSIGELQKDLVMVSSVRGEGLDDKKIPPAEREALMAMMNRQFNYDDIQDLKTAGVAGEKRNGLLAFISTERSKADSAFNDFARKLIAEENKDRTVIMQRVISINANLTKKDLPTIQSIMHKLAIQSSPPGSLYEAESGKWQPISDTTE